MDSLLKDGRVARGWLGVLIQDLRPEMAAAFEATDESGVLIGDVVPDSPADRAGLKRGDVLTSLNGRALNSASELRNQVGMMKPGEKVRLALLREGKNRELGLKLGELPDTREEAVAAASRGSLDGLRLGPLDAQNRARFEVPNSVGDGLVVVEIVPGSAAAEAGLRPGDVILEVARKAVRTLEDVESQWENSPGKILLLVSRGGNTMYLMVSPS